MVIYWRRAPDRAVKSTRKATSTAADVEVLAHSVRVSGGKVVFTNGVFDLLHPGHVRYLEAARRLGDVLIVGLNSDHSVRTIKGPARPLTPEQERAEMLLALKCVDAVVLFDQQTPQHIITTVQPDILVKGADWRHDEIVGRDIVETRGGSVVRIALAEGYSTTELIRRVTRSAQSR